MRLARGWQLPDGDIDDIELDAATRRRGVYCLGVPGCGKTSLMRHALRVDMEEGNDFVCIDVEGSFDLPVTRFDPVRAVTPFNLLRSRDSVEHLVTAFRRHLGTSFMDLAEDMLRHSCLVLLEHRLGLDCLPRFLSDEPYRNGLVRGDHSESVEFFFKHRRSLAKTAWPRDVESTRNKIAKLFLHPAIKPCLAARDCLPIEGQILASFPESVFAGQSGLLGALFAGYIYEQSLKRPIGSPLMTIYCDEFQTCATQTFVELSLRGRKRGIGIFVAQQSLKQPPFDKDPGLLTALYNSVGTSCFFELGWDDAMFLSSHVLPGTGDQIKMGSDQEPEAFWAVREFDRQMAQSLHNQKQGECFIKIKGKGTFEAVTYDVSDLPEPQNTPSEMTSPPLAAPEPARAESDAEDEDDGEYEGDPV